MRLGVMLRTRDLALLRVVARGWGVKPATAAWAILAERLAMAERREPEFGRVGLAIAAAVGARIVSPPAVGLLRRDASDRTAVLDGLRHE